MSETQNTFNNAFDSWSTKLDYVEVADDNTRAILTIPLFHVGPNKKNLFWTEEMLEEIVPLYFNCAFRYDLDGKEGSSHTIKKLSSPHFDVGWTYEGEDGSWYDPKTKSLWVKGEITHPQVIAKLQRTTSDGKREVNFASMGIIVEEAKCSICGAIYGDICENGHERGQVYDMETCYKVPVKCSKGLHVALTNDPADAEAVIADCVFQELGGSNMFDKKKDNNTDSKGPIDENKDVPSNQNLQSSNGLNNPEGKDPKGDQMSPENEMRKQSSTDITSTDNSQIPGGLAPSSPQTEQPGTAPSPQIILKDLAERIKTLENQINTSQMNEGTPELVNSAPQDQMTQSNMGVTSQFEETTEENNMDVKDGQTTDSAVPVNPKETQDMNQADPMSQIMQMLQQILAQMGGNTEVQDVNELENANKSKIVHDETKPTEHEAPGDAVSAEASTSEGNKKNKQHMNEPGKVATAEDDQAVASKTTEVADLRKQVDLLTKKIELQSTEIPEFGSAQPAEGATEVADMGAEGRVKNFGEYGAWDSIFKGAESAGKFKR